MASLRSVSISLFVACAFVSAACSSSSSSGATGQTCSSATVSGCSAQGQVYVTVTDPYLLYRPNAFMPGSTFNDHFTMFTSDGQPGQIRNLSIYDRWGELVFQKTNFPANDPALGWDGSCRGKACAAGMYIYYVELAWLDGRVDIYKGDVTLLR